MNLCWRNESVPTTCLALKFGWLGERKVCAAPMSGITPQVPLKMMLVLLMEDILHHLQLSWITFHGELICAATLIAGGILCSMPGKIAPILLGKPYIHPLHPGITNDTQVSTKKTLIDVCRGLCVVSVVVNGFFYPPFNGRLQFVAHGAYAKASSSFGRWTHRRDDEAKCLFIAAFCHARR